MNFKKNLTQKLQNYFSLQQLQLLKVSFFIHNTTPYIHLRLDSILEIVPGFPDCDLSVMTSDFASSWLDVILETFETA